MIYLPVQVFNRTWLNLYQEKDNPGGNPPPFQNDILFMDGENVLFMDGGQINFMR